MSESNNDVENLQEWGLEKFLTSEELANLSWAERMEYEDKLKRYRDWHNVIAYAREEGRKRGLRKVKQEEKLSIVKAFKANGVSIDIIQKSTGLSKEEIEKL